MVMMLLGIKKRFVNNWNDFNFLFVGRVVSCNEYGYKFCWCCVWLILLLFLIGN